ncbi:hypothetical protein BX661DRAFT_182406 [Kickxella alabastrina]|uniref:uncharacterized protein n=1 Tax=Kickxella alabastrina TaxID=61397 RepID=UPI00221F6D11|nr:uncharacterized protein BX661DRAFT_182406 [Kickxella alabastrina]KAI7827766.1 hypothetical protein BX661DRAFT_182406 [Kickxella alabastrina]
MSHFNSPSPSVSDLNTKSEQRIRHTSETDATIRSRWATEAYAQGLTKRKLTTFLPTGILRLPPHARLWIFLSAVEQVWISDTLIDDETEQALRILESGPEDWHPGSEGVVRNLIHPSLFPLIYGRSALYPKDLEQWGVEVNRAYKESASDDEDAEDTFYTPLPSVHRASKKFCWLPSEFQVHQDGHVTVESYINNLHPLKYALCSCSRTSCHRLAHRREQRVVPAPYAWFDDSDEPKDYDAEDYDEKYDLWQETRPFIEPQPEPFQWPDRRRLQAIVKMSNIILTPENPVYEGGAWHVEALANERIIATSNLAFREMVDEELDYEQGDERGLNLAYGIYENVDDTSDVPLIQEIGRVEAKRGRCVVFPNMYQHRVEGFQLKDPKRSGCRKIFAFFFIDPTTRIPSPRLEVMSIGPLRGLPLLVKNGILENVDFPISLDEAKNRDSS